MNISGI
ncbi:hypothetical protein QTP86_014026 [Hemibagrus guttatus]|nr:hypothetical protein QTP86_014026 [Hemibagrus guttatus]